HGPSRVLAPSVGEAAAGSRLGENTPPTRPAVGPVPDDAVGAGSEPGQLMDEHLGIFRADMSHPQSARPSIESHGESRSSETTAGPAAPRYHLRPVLPSSVIGLSETDAIRRLDLDAIRKTPPGPPDRTNSVESAWNTPEREHVRPVREGRNSFESR